MAPSYDQFLETIYSLAKPSGTAKDGIERMKRLSALHNNPQLSFSTIHIAGTNGKGSVCTKIASALTEQGYKTGLYTSPHITSFCERIRIDGQPIAEHELLSLYQSLSETPPSFFEIATLLAFLHFRKQQVDIAVIETGLGGAYDATNIVRPILSIITSIGLDHCDILGSTLQEICRAKAGILKPNTPALLGPSVPLHLIDAPAGCTLHSLNSASDHYELENRSIAEKALELLSPLFPLSDASLQQGLAATPPCRFEILRKEKTVVLDVAHNPQGFERLIERLHLTFPGASFRFICAFSKDKEIGACAKLIESCASAIHLPIGSYPRLASTQEASLAFHRPVQIEPGISTAVAKALRAPSPEIVVIAGSFYIMHEAKLALGIMT